MTDTLTPIWDMPLPGILPSGVTPPQEQEITAGIRVLGKYGPATGPDLASGKLAGLTVIRSEEPSDEGLRALDGIFKSGLAEYAALKQPTHYALHQPVVTREMVVREVDRLRSSMFLTADDTAAIAGLGARRYYELVGGKPVPAGRLAEIFDRVSIINALAARDWQTASTLLRTRLTETIELLDGGRLRDLHALFRVIQEERVVLVRGGTGFALPELAARNERELSGILDAPAFEIIAKVISWVGREDLVKQRSKAMVELFGVFKTLADDGQVGERWDFLYGLRADERTAFNAKAEAFIRSDAFTSERWETFVTAESERAWNAVEIVRLDPLEETVETYGDEGEPPMPWRPSMAEIAARVRPYERERE
jgi:hypothetical protein